LYIGNSQLISILGKGVFGGVLPCSFGEFGGGCEMVEEVEDGGEGGGVSPFPPFSLGVLSPLSSLPLGVFEISLATVYSFLQIKLSPFLSYHKKLF
jgi:hypothetical protein